MFFVGLAVLWAHAPTAHAAASSTPLSWEAARAEAQALVAQMSAAEKASLMLGTGWSEGTLTKWHFVGNVPPIARLGVPPLNMMDAAGGFRTYWTELVGTVTCWPSLLMVRCGSGRFVCTTTIMAVVAMMIFAKINENKRDRTSSMPSVDMYHPLLCFVSFRVVSFRMVWLESMMWFRFVWFRAVLFR